MDWLTETPIAHRGLHEKHEDIPENSLVAFEAARDAGYPIELDVRVLRDGAVVVFHDADLRRMTGTTGPVAEETAETISTYRLARTRERIPFLGESLDLVAGRVPLLVELKVAGEVGPLEQAVVDALVSYRGPRAVQSFGPLSMSWFRHHTPGEIRGLVSGDFRDEALDEPTKRRLRDLSDLDSCDPAFLCYDIRSLPSEPVARARSRGLPLIGWTVRTDADRSHAESHCDNYIFEHIRPGVRKPLAENGDAEP